MLYQKTESDLEYSMRLFTYMNVFYIALFAVCLFIYKTKGYEDGYIKSTSKHYSSSANNAVELGDLNSRNSIAI